jgi:TRAP-type mannitol/chloroaromatic compound transport system permease large subunit
MKFKIINKQSLCIPEDPVFVLDTTCVLKNLKVVEKFFRSKKKVFEPVQISKKNFFELFSSIFWGICTGTKGGKVVLFGLSTGTKYEFRIFEE